MEDIKLWQLEGSRATPLASNNRLESEQLLEETLVENPAGAGGKSDCPGAGDLRGLAGRRGSWLAIGLTCSHGLPEHALVSSRLAGVYTTSPM